MISSMLILGMLAAPIVALLLISVSSAKRSRQIMLGSSIAGLAMITAAFIIALHSGSASINAEFPYISSLGISFGISVNVISMMLLLMSSIVIFAAALAGNVEGENARTSAALIALFQLASAGLFSSGNLFMFFIFWDIGVISMFLMINILGSSNRKSASLSFLVYEIFASSMLLLAMLLIFFYTPVHSFSFQYIAAHASLIPGNIELAVFALLFMAFMTNMPIFPMHFWLPDAHTEASTQGSMLLSGALTKFGGFGMVLLFTMLPLPSKAYGYIAALAAFSVFYSVFLLMKQSDIKRVIAYSTIVEMGIVMVGISAANAFGIYGAAYAMLSHGLVIAMMFLIAGTVKHMLGERNINLIRGVVSSSKLTAYAFLGGALAMVGFPLTSGFIADILLFLGSVQAFGMAGLVPLTAIIFMGAFMYMLVSRCMLSTREITRPVDFARAGQKAGYLVLMALIFAFGIFPFLFLGLIRL